MTLKLLLAAAATAAAALAASSAGAATITVLGFVQNGDAYTNVTPVSTTGVVDVGITGSSSGLYADAYGGTDLAGRTAYNSVRGGGSMTYDISGLAGDSFTLIWGSVDDYNYVDFGGDTVGGSSVLAALAGIGQGAANVIVRITADSPFSNVTLRSDGNAFEHAFNPPELAAVPVPAAGLLLAAALGGMGVASRRRKAA